MMLALLLLPPLLVIVVILLLLRRIIVSCFRTDACLFSTLPAATPFSVISRVTFFAASAASATLCFVDCRFNANGRTRDTDVSGSAAEGACRLPATSNPLPLRRILYLSSSGEARAFTGRCSGGLASKSPNSLMKMLAASTCCGSDRWFSRERTTGYGDAVNASFAIALQTSRKGISVQEV